MFFAEKWFWKMAQKLKKVESKLGSRLSQNLVQVCCATSLDQV